MAKTFIQIKAELAESPTSPTPVEMSPDNPEVKAINAKKKGKKLADLTKHPTAGDEVFKGKATSARASVHAEEVELDELSKKTLGRYISRAGDDRDQKSSDAGILTGRNANKDEAKRAKALNKKAGKRANNIDRAIGKLAKEEADFSEAKKFDPKAAVDDMTKSIISDVYKDVYGIRPRSASFWNKIKNMGDADQLLTRLSNNMGDNDQHERDSEEKERRVQKKRSFGPKIGSSMAAAMKKAGFKTEEWQTDIQESKSVELTKKAKALVKVLKSKGVSDKQIFSKLKAAGIGEDIILRVME